jgi:hypothetical protein
VVVSELLHVPLPAFVRKLGRKRHWGSPDQPEAERIAEILGNVFLNDQLPYSLYRVSSDTDLHRVALALNAGRKAGSLTEDSSFVAFGAEELETVNVRAQPTVGDTPCRYANHLHHDASASEDQLRQLVTQAIRAGRTIASLTKGVMKRVVETAIRDQCFAAVTDAVECKAEGCSGP